MRITGGSLKGSEIISKKQKDTHIRPTAGKIREAIFNLLHHGKFLNEVDFLDDNNPSIIEDRVVADIYSGTGILGFEALSRGAKTIILADESDESIKLSKKTAHKLRLEDKTIFLRCNATNLPTPPAIVDLVLIDPPYEKNLVMPCLKSLIDKNWLRDGGIVLVEHSKKEDVLETTPFKILDSRPYNNTMVTILKKV